MKKIKIICLALFLGSTIIVEAQSTKCSCCEAEFRSFDFWLGEWDVSAKGKAAGFSQITIDQDSCLIVENWSSATSDYKGTSYNFYDKKNKLWHQTWVDNKGGNLKLKGVFDNGRMVLMDEPKLNPKNQLQINKITWSPNADGSVRQHWEVTVDLGISWTTLFDGLYRAK